MYWAITTLTGTGYGDIVPVNTSERIIATIAFVLGSSLFGYVTANVTEVVASFSKAEQVTNLSMAKMDEYLIKFKIQRGLRMDVVDHSRQVMKYRSVFDSRFILTRLPPHIRVAILAHQNIDVIKHIRLFHYIRNPSIRVLLLGVMKRQYAIDGRALCIEGEPCVKLRFLISGKAIILRRKPDPRKPFTHTPVARKAPEFGIYNERLGHSGRVVEMDDDMFDHSEQIGELTPGEFVGEDEFLLNRAHTTTVVAVEKCCYYTLMKEQVDDLINTHPDAAFELQAALGQLLYDSQRLLTAKRRQVRRPYRTHA